MIIPLCLLVFIGLGQCQDEVPSRFQIQTSINRTIDEVERLIREDPKLPRLSRSEIVDILFNITSKDVTTFEDKNSIDKARAEYRRALMVVLPYSPNSSDDNLKDLYTKPPMVQMIPDDMSETENVEMVDEDGKIEEIVYPEESHKPSLAVNFPSTNFVVTENADDSNLAENDMEESNASYENHRDTYSEVIDPIEFKKSSSDGSYHSIYPNDEKRRPIYAEAPERFSFNLNNLQVTPTTTVEPIRSTVGNNPEEIEDSVSTDSKLEIVYSTTVNTKKPPTTKIVTEIPRQMTTESTTISSGTTHRNVLTSGQWHYNAPPTTMETLKKVYPEYKFKAETVSSVDAKDQIDSVTSSSTTTRKPEVRIKIQGQNSEKKYGNQGHLVEAEKPGPIFVTPMSTNSQDVVKNKFSSSYSANHGGVVKISSTMPPMRSEVKDLLASIGLSEGDPDQQPQIENNVAIPGSNDLTSHQISGLEATGIDSPSILSQNTFGSTSYDYKIGTQNLTPDMQLLLQRFGLQTSQSDAHSTTTKKPTPIVVNLNSYSSFRPLPTAKVEDNDMRDFLAKFGLGVNDSEKNRSHKSIKTRKHAEVSPPSLIEAVPDSMKKILENIGLISRSQKSVEVKSTSSYSSETATTPKLHVFKPHEVPVHTEEQKEKINKLLDTVKKVQSGMANSHDVQVAAKDLLDTTKTLQNGPDPISLEEILNIYNEGIKNEVKRQEEATTTADDSGTTTPLTTETTTSTTTTTTTSSDAFNVAALADSFGGSTRAPDPVLPMQRKTGLYFLVDWNTFLDVGEDGPDKVNLRFQPKVGDRTRFIPVTVP